MIFGLSFSEISLRDEDAVARESPLLPVYTRDNTIK